MEGEGDLEDGDPLNNFFKKIFASVSDTAVLPLSCTGAVGLWHAQPASSRHKDQACCEPLLVGIQQR